jgi:hypothetical protein
MWRFKLDLWNSLSQVSHRTFLDLASILLHSAVGWITIKKVNNNFEMIFLEFLEF